MNELRAKAKGLLLGLEGEVHLALDVMLPAERVIDALKAFRAEFPTVSLRLRVEALGAVMQSVVDRVATIGVSGPSDELIAGSSVSRSAASSWCRSQHRSSPAPSRT